MTIVKFPAQSNAVAKQALPLPKPKLFEALLDPEARQRIVWHIVDTKRELISREDAVDYWMALTENYRARCHREGAEPALIDRAMKLLFRDVKAENERRKQIALDAAADEPPLLGFDRVEQAKVLRFPGDETEDGEPIFMPHGFIG